jgi:hypothetical protein
MPEESGNKRSQAVVLTLVGLPMAAIGIASAFPDHIAARNLYPDRAACERDYSTAQCEQNGSGSSSSGGHGGSGSGWHGPYYTSTSASSSDPGPGRTGQITRTEVSSRGGFGAIGRGLRAVG